MTDTAKISKLVKEAWDLEVFKLAYSISLEIHEITKQFPKEEQFGLTSQMRRASKSICANIAEGFAKQLFSDVEFRRFLSMAMGSATEMQVWVRYCVDLAYISSDQAAQWQSTYQRIAKMLVRLHAGSHPVI